MSIDWMNLIIALLGGGLISFLSTWAVMSLCKDNEVARLLVAGLMPPLCAGVGILIVKIWPVLK